MFSPTTPSPMPPTPQRRRNNYDHPHSDLEVVPDSADHDKTFIANSPYSHHDKILVPPQPYYQKEVVEVQQNVYPDIHSLASAAYDETEPPPIPPARREKILGLRRKTFFILVWILTIALAIAIGVGAGVGASSSRNNSAAAATGTRDEIITASPRLAAPPNNGDPATTSSSSTRVPGRVWVTTRTKSGSTFTSSITIITEGADDAVLQTGPIPWSPDATSTPSPTTTRTASITTAVPSQSSSTGGRCSNQWGADCVCLDQGICANVWRGTAYTGYEGNWPCPGAAANVMACVVKPCLGKAKGAQCLWREACREVNPASAGSAAICPGDGEFVCCAHEWV